MLILRRDPHALLVLFAMPAIFVLVMSLALEDRFAQGDATVATVLVADADGGDAARALVERVRSNGAFRIKAVDADAQALRERLRADGAAFALRIESGFGAAVGGADARAAARLHLLVAPRVDRQREALLLAAVRQALGRARVAALAQRLAPLSGIDPDAATGEPRVEYVYARRELANGAGEGAGRPSSVQQNVPAWLVFGLFFIVIPLSNTMVRERAQGMERRLRTTPAGPGALLCGKLLPYFALNQLQVIAMLAVGAFLVPALGGTALEIAGVPMATLVLMAVAVSIAALGYAMLIAVVSASTEQAAMLGGGGNIILAAIGGIMVPEFVMPPALQTATLFSPMAWGLDGFLIGFLHNGGVRAVAPQAAALTAFGAGGMALAWLLQRRRAQ
jgi:ABC-2 type transport system permease protein